MSKQITQYAKMHNISLLLYILYYVAISSDIHSSRNCTLVFISTAHATLNLWTWTKRLTDNMREMQHWMKKKTLIIPQDKCLRMYSKMQIGWIFIAIYNSRFVFWWDLLMIQLMINQSILVVQRQVHCWRTMLSVTAGLYLFSPCTGSSTCPQMS